MELRIDATVITTVVLCLTVLVFGRNVYKVAGSGKHNGFTVAIKGLGIGASWKFFGKPNSKGRNHTKKNRTVTDKPTQGDQDDDQK